VKTLTETGCVPCRGGTPPLGSAQVEELLRQVPEWRVVETEGILRITRTFSFDDFRQALAFTVSVGELAEREQHHPDIHLGWGKVRIEVWTHKIRGLHENDFIIAAKADAIYVEARSNR